MKKRTKSAKKLGTYYDIYVNITNNVRNPVSRIANEIGYTGRGKRRATIFKYLNEMYQQQIMFYPNLLLKTFESPKWEAFLLKKRNEDLIYGTFKQIREDVSYALYLSGKYDYFVTCKCGDFEYSAYDVEIGWHSRLYTPLFTEPRGWKYDFKETVNSIYRFNFEKGYLERSIKGVLEWDDLDYKIFDLMKGNAREKYKKVADELTDNYKLNVHQSTVKRHFMNNILPNCSVAHYFFPKGYNYYNQSFFFIHSTYEKSLVKAFHLLPCTTYVYPFEKGIGCNIFHRNINDLMSMMEKLKGEKIIDSFSVFTPLRYD